MKNKILTFGFDDCEIYDRRLCELFRKYNIKATFFLISDQLGFTCPHYRYGEDTIVERVSAGELKDTYKDMEIASHTCAHAFSENEVERDVLKSMENLSNACGYRVEGFAYPGGVYNQNHIKALKKENVLYARTVKCTHSFELPSDFLEWHPTCSYDDEDMDTLIEKFLSYEGETPALFYIFGHSYELTRSDKKVNFEGFEKMLQKLGNRNDIWYATNTEIAKKYKK